MAEYNAGYATSSLYDDSKWIRSIFLVDESDIRDDEKELIRNWSSADLKFTDTSPGGSLCINPLPQPTIWADPAPLQYVYNDGTNVPNNGGGMGVYFSEAFDDNYRTVSFRFGHMAHRGVLSFLAGAYSPRASGAANKGIINSTFGFLSTVIGNVLAVVAWPALALAFVGKAINYALRKPSSKYCYLKPAMPLYWLSAQGILNELMVNAGIMFRTKPMDDNKETLDTQDDDIAEYADKDNVQEARNKWQNTLGDIFPDVNGSFIKNGAIDLLALVNKAQIQANKRREEFAKILGATDFKSRLKLKGALKQIYKEKIMGVHSKSLADLLNEYDSDAAAFSKASNKAGAEAQKSVYNDTYDGIKITGKEGEEIDYGDLNIQDGETNPDDAFILDELVNGIKNPRPSFWQQLAKYFISEVNEGAAFLTLRVDDTGPVSDNFSNSYKQSSLAEKINSMSSTMRDTSFNMSHGKFTNGALGNIVGSGIEAVKSFVGNTMESMGIGGLAILGGGGVIDINKYWESSETSIGRPSYELTLTSRYANRIVATLDIYVQLSCILAMVMPLSTGKSSHTAPFYCEIYDKGRFQSRLAAVESVTITRGEGEMGFTPDGKLMSVRVGINVLPMEEMVALPISKKFSLSGSIFGTIVGGFAKSMGFSAGVNTVKALTLGLFDDDTPYTDYMAVLAGMGLYEQIYTLQKIKRQFLLNSINVRQSFYPTRLAAFAGDSMIGQLISAFMLGRDEY